MDIPEDGFWLNMWLILHRQAEENFPTTSVVHIPSFHGTSEDFSDLSRRIEELKIVSSQHDSEIDAAIDKSPLDLRSRGLEPPAQVWLYRRLEAASLLARSLSMLGNDIGILVFRPAVIEEREVVQFLLKDWWYEHGLTMWAATNLHS